MAKGKYKFQTIQVTKGGQRRFHSSRQSGPSIRGTGTAARVQLLKMAVDGLGQLSHGYRLQKELNKLQPEIDRQMPENGGVRLRITYQVSGPDGTGSYARRILNVGTAGVGASPVEAQKDWDSQARIYPAAPEGWKTENEYMWVTPSVIGASPASEIDNSTLGLLNDALEKCDQNYTDHLEPKVSVDPTWLKNLSNSSKPIGPVDKDIFDSSKNIFGPSPQSMNLDPNYLKNLSRDINKPWENDHDDNFDMPPPDYWNK